MNVRLLNKIKKHILEEPNRLAMGTWIERGKPGKELETNDGGYQKFAKCGTAACIAGWACLLSKDYKNGYPVQEFAAEVLDIEYPERLFYVDYWPDVFADGYQDATSPRQRAKVAGQRIDYLVAKGL